VGGWAFISVALIGGLVGWTELAQRYRDRPTGPLRTLAGATYVLVNALAAMGALALVRHLDLAAETGLPKDVAQVLLAGLGAMAFFRSAFFTMRVGDADLPLGPALVLQVILNAADRAYDRFRAAERSRAVSRIMRDVSFERAKQPLPAYCMKLMQNVSPEEAQRLATDLKALDEAGMGPRSKSQNLGLLLMNVVGETTLETAVKDLGNIILMPNDADMRLLAESRRFALDDRAKVLWLCRFLNPDAPVDGVPAELEAIVAAGEADEVKAIALLAVLRRVFGSAVLEAALRKRREDG
jgi:hypothetical protein